MDDKSLIELLLSPLNLLDCYNFVLKDNCGAISTFVGTVRNFNKGKEVTHLEFEAYIPMALKELNKIAEECFKKFTIEKIIIQHRIGRVNIEEKAVIIAISSVHRKAAIEAVEYAMNRLKETVPIWKKEFHPDGSYWVNATP